MKETEGVTTSTGESIPDKVACLRRAIREREFDWYSEKFRVDREANVNPLKPYVLIARDSELCQAERDAKPAALLEHQAKCAAVEAKAKERESKKNSLETQFLDRCFETFDLDKRIARHVELVDIAFEYGEFAGEAAYNENGNDSVSVVRHECILELLARLVRVMQ
jgi:hypothetical protein